MMRWLRRLHAWIGLGLCLLLALMALTGALLVFEPQLRDFGRPAGQAPAPANLPAIVAAAEARFGPDAFSSIVFASPHAAWSEVRLKTGEHAWVDHQMRVQPFASGDRIVEWVFDLHHQLLLGDLGEKIIGTAGLIGVTMALSGIVLWWPARRSFSAAVVPKRPSRAGWLGAHRDLAIMVAPMAMLSMLTGASMALPNISRPLLAAPTPSAPKAASIGAGPTNWPAGLAAARTRFPGATVRMAVAPSKAGQPASVRLRQAGEWHANGRTIVFLDPPTGQVLSVYDAQAQNRGARIFNAFWPLHAARVGGTVWTVLIFLGGLGLAALSLYGGEAYRRKLMGR